jgi:Putative lumazine-binding
VAAARRAVSFFFLLLPEQLLLGNTIMTFFNQSTSTAGWRVHLRWVALAAVLPMGVVAAEPAAAEGGQPAAQRVIESFAAAADRGDTSALQPLLHPSFRVVFKVSANGAATVLDRQQFLAMVSDGKIGGAPRKVVLSAVQGSGAFLSAAARMERPDALFQGAYSLIFQDGRWLLLEEAVLMGKPSAAR